MKPRKEVRRAVKPRPETLINPAQAGDARLLSEFQYAVHAWMTDMTPKAQREALAMVQAKISE